MKSIRKFFEYINSIVRKVRSYFSKKPESKTRKAGTSSNGSDVYFTPGKSFTAVFYNQGNFFD